MLLPVTDTQYTAFALRLQTTIHNAASLDDLRRIHPSMTILRKQCLTVKRTWLYFSIAQDYHFILKRLGGHHALTN